jgi:hypothetical protein
MIRPPAQISINHQRDRQRTRESELKMSATSTLQASVPLVVEGQLASVNKSNSLQTALKNARVTLIGPGRLARVEMPASPILLHAVKIVTRPSGRKHRHLARYLLGYTDQGVLWEIFLDSVRGLQNTFFEWRVALQAGLLGLTSTLLSVGLGPRQMMTAVCR